MIYSMTGYGKSTVEGNGISVDVEIKSLNNRFLDLFLRLPQNIQPRELELREIIRSYIKRGKISVICNIDYHGESSGTFEIDVHALGNVILELKNIVDHSNIKDEIKLRDLLEFKDYFLSEVDKENDEEFTLTVKALKGALENLIEMRKQEGAALQKDLLERTGNIEKKIEEVEKLAKRSVEEYFRKMQLRAEQLLGNLEIERDRLNMELALMVEKYDITEELVRLKSHTEMFRQTLNQNSEAGKRLNFILQEMNRETNTINSKTISSEISHIGIQLKEELEKMREQVQNVE